MMVCYDIGSMSIRRCDAGGRGYFCVDIDKALRKTAEASEAPHTNGLALPPPPLRAMSTRKTRPLWNERFHAPHKARLYDTSGVFDRTQK